MELRHIMARACRGHPHMALDFPEDAATVLRQGVRSCHLLPVPAFARNGLPDVETVVKKITHAVTRNRRVVNRQFHRLHIGVLGKVKGYSFAGNGDLDPRQKNY
jgi:hypothetical protein